ncbi:MAG: threonine--tRNA ligase [Nitrospirae bacterium]|nr:threonine--tRNA ligase [Nitrospirota bacterium]
MGNIPKDAVAILVNGQVCEASGDMPEGGRALTCNDPEGLAVYRHSVSHIMAHAVADLFPGTRFAIGPSTADGFYYDFDSPQPFTPEDLKKIEKRMSQIIKAANPFKRAVMNRDDAIRMFEEKGEIYKVELLREIADDTVSLYEEGGFADLCRGPHLPHTGRVKAFALLSIAGAYWRGDEKNKMLQRIYGTAFGDAESLKKHLDFLEEVKRRDHRRLGKDLDLFSIGDETGSGLVLWHPKGATIRRVIEDFWRAEHEKADYQNLYTPHMARLDLWKQSGHWDFYRENMYAPMEVEGQLFEIKPMNCPFHIAIYKSHLRSYRDLPIRYCELGTVYRFERSGALHGLLRVRGFTQDDAHIFCAPDQIQDEISRVLEFTLFVLKTFGFENYDVYLSTRPEKYVGDLEHWETATDALRQALEKSGIRYEVDPGEGVFYGPKIDIKVKDTLGRAWQCSTIQVDFNLPERFDISFQGSDGAKHRPIMVHRALMGSLERFFGVLIEHYAGAFPVWLSPVQVRVMTVAERHADHANSVVKALRAAGVRADVDVTNEKIGYKVRIAAMDKIPYLLTVGDREVEQGIVNVRRRGGENIGEMTVDAFGEMVAEEVAGKR